MLITNADWSPRDGISSWQSMWTRGHRTQLSLWPQRVNCPLVFMSIGVHQSQWVWMFPIPGCAISVWNTCWQFRNNTVCKTVNEYNVYHHMVFPKCLLSSAAYKISICIHLKPVEYAFNNVDCMTRRKVSVKIAIHNPCTFRNHLLYLKSGEKKNSWSIFRVSWNTSTSMCTWIRFMSLIKTRRVCKILLNNLRQAPPNLSFLGHHQHTLYRWLFTDVFASGNVSQGSYTEL